MKWLSEKYAVPLVLMVILASIGFQAIWLTQLFHAQEIQVKRDLDQAVDNAARMNDYLSVVHGHEKSENFRDFFLSREWLQFKQAFTGMRARHVSARFSSSLMNDSTVIDISLRMANGKPQPRRNRVVRTFDDGETLESARLEDKHDLMRMDSLVRLECEKNQLTVKTFHILYDYDTGKPEQPNVWKAAQLADYHSQLYAYNLNFFFHNYQLVVQSINNLVFYRMRYYLFSSLLMLVMTGLAFVFLFRMIRSQRLYTHARLAFTGNMTHELKTPVAIIEASLDAITRYGLSRDPQKFENYLDISKSELQRLNLMIDKVLDLDQLDNGNIKLRPELYDVQEGLISVISAMKLREEQSGATITYLPNDEPCFVSGDPVHLTNVFYNLIDNALKYSGSNAAITILCECVHEKVLISIQDNGPGIDKIYKERIFERFFRIPEQPDVHNVQGSGLGLYYVKQVIEQHRGSVKVSSQPGKGSNFVINIPAYHEI